MHFSRGYGNTFLRDEDDDDDQVSPRNIFRVEEKIRANVGKAQIGRDLSNIDLHRGYDYMISANGGGVSPKADAVWKLSKGSCLKMEC